MSEDFEVRLLGMWSVGSNAFKQISEDLEPWPLGMWCLGSGFFGQTNEVVEAQPLGNGSPKSETFKQDLKICSLEQTSAVLEDGERL